MPKKQPDMSIHYNLVAQSCLDAIKHSLEDDIDIAIVLMPKDSDLYATASTASEARTQKMIATLVDDKPRIFVPEKRIIN